MPTGKTVAPWVFAIESAHWAEDKGIVADVFKSLTDAGFAAVYVKHRLAPPGKIPGQVGNGQYPQQTDDLEMALAKAKTDSRCDGRIGDVGGSGGANLAAYLASKGEVFASVAFSPATNLPDLIVAGGAPASKAINYAPTDAARISASPITYLVNGLSTPVMLVAFQVDQMPMNQYTDYDTALTSKGIDHASYLLNGTGHSWVGRTQVPWVAFLTSHLPALPTPTPTPSPTPSPTPTPTDTPTPTPTDTPSPSPTDTPGPPNTGSNDPRGIYEYGSGDTFDYVNGWAQVILWQNANPADGVYDWGKLDSLIADAKAAGKQLSLKIRCFDSAPDWVKSTVPTYTYSGTKTPMVLPWQVEPQVTKFLLALFKRYDGQFTYFTLGLGTSVETHMPLPSEIGVSTSQTDFANSYLGFSERIVDLAGANLGKTHFMIAAGAVWKGDTTTITTLMNYGLKYRLWGVQQWGLNATSNTSFFINQFIQGHSPYAGGFQMTGASDGTVGGALQGTLDQCLTAAENLNADFVEVYRQDTGLAANAAVLKKHNDSMLAKGMSRGK